MKTAPKSPGLVDALIASFAGALKTPAGEAKPTTLLWADPDSQWREVIPELQTAIRELYVLGPYQPEKRSGPAIWLKCIVDRTIPEYAPAEDIIPILYLPGVNRQELRSGSDCRAAWQPLIELQYRGEVWHQPNGRDWSVEAFLVSKEGLGLEIAQDSRTQEAMRRALPLLADASVESLRGRRLDSDDFDKLAVSDPVRDVLRWMSDPDGVRKSLDAPRWRSFCNVCKTDFNFDPEEDGSSVAANSLSVGGGRWDDIWRRFCEAPRLYPGISDVLREPRQGQGKLSFEQSRSPRANEEAEAILRHELEGATQLPHHDLCERILKLESEHGRRREWVWAQLGESPLATALEPISRLATLSRTPFGGSTLEVFTNAYASAGWRCDRAVLEAVALKTNGAQSDLLAHLLALLYSPWLEAGARRLQELVDQESEGLSRLVKVTKSEDESCLLFVDGLRFDVGATLLEKLEARSLKVQLSHRVSALPTVTATAKPAATPVAALVEGTKKAEDFMPVISATKQPATAPRLREAIATKGFELINSEELRMPAGAQARGWTEIGRIDELGHKLGVGLASQIENELERISDRVIALLDSGWRRVRIVTDHGWLLLPGGLPKFELPPYLVATKWARCAMVRGEATPEIPIYPWYWNAAVRIASPPGIACFSAGYEYAHGGISPQECIVPQLVVERGTGALKAEILSVQWRGMRCRVKVRSSGSGVSVDLRMNWKRAETSLLAAGKEVTAEGEASVVVENDMHEGASATVVVIDGTGTVLDRKPTTVGESQ